MFYSFLSISSRYYHPNIGVQYDINSVGDGMKVATYGVTLLLLFLIKYVNNYMIRRKQKEFAIQTIMGMEQKTTARIFFVETLLMGCVSLVIGIVGGILFSQFVTAMLLSSYGQPYRVQFMFYPDTVFLTICFFLISFIVMGIFNIRTISKIKVIDMLKADKINDPDLRSSKWMPGFKRGKRSFSKLILLLLAFDIPIIFLISCVPILQRKYYLAIGQGSINTYLLLFLIGIIFAIAAIFYLAGDMIIRIKEKSITCRYREENLFFFGQIISKLKTTTKTMTLICFTLVLSISLFLSTPALVEWTLGYLQSRTVFDVRISSRYNNVYDLKELPDTNYTVVSEYLDAANIAVAADVAFSLYLPTKEEFSNREKLNFPVLAMALSDYNKLRVMKGYEIINLQPNEFTTQWTVTTTQDEIQGFIKKHQTIDTDGGKLSLAKESIFQDNLGETLYNQYTNVIYIFPDEICKELLSVNKNRYIQTVSPIPLKNAKELGDVFSKAYPELGEGVSYTFRTNTDDINSTKAMIFITKASMTYGAIVLLIMCFTILALQQLLDATHYCYRFGVLRKMGVEEKHIDKLILKQLGVWFGLPIGVAILASIIFAIYFFSAISNEIQVFVGINNLIVQLATVIAILITLLFCYFTCTWMLFKGMVSKK